MKIRLITISVLHTFFGVLLLLFTFGCNNGQISYSVSDFGDTLSKTELFKKGSLAKVSYYEYNEDGEKYISDVIFYKDSIMHGVAKTYHSNGQLKSEVEFKSGKIWNVMTYLDSSGNNLDYGHIDDGNGRLKMYYRDISVLKEEGDVVNGKKEGYWYSFCGNGVEVCDSTFFNNGRDEFMDSWEELGNHFFQEYH